MYLSGQIRRGTQAGPLRWEHAPSNTQRKMSVSGLENGSINHSGGEPEVTTQKGTVQCSELNTSKSNEQNWPIGQELNTSQTLSPPIPHGERLSCAMHASDMIDLLTRT
jgi:hypothetical protein